MDFRKYLEQGLRIIRLDREAAVKASKDSEAFVMGLLFLVLGGAAGGLSGMMTSRAGAAGFIASVVGFVLSFAVFSAAIFGVSKVFGGKAAFVELFRPIGLASLLAWACIVPFVGHLIFLWLVVVWVVVLESVSAMSRGRAILSVLGGIAAAALVSIPLACITCGALTPVP